MNIIIIILFCVRLRRYGWSGEREGCSDSMSLNFALTDCRFVGGNKTECVLVEQIWGNAKLLSSIR